MNQATKIALFAMAAGLAACSESSTAPVADASESTAYVNGGGATMDLSPTNVVRFSITIDPSRNTYYYLGAGNSLIFPAGTLCNPYKSTYGNGEWDNPCVPATYPITVNVSAWLDQYGHARVDFDKHVRFVPSTNPAKWVVITFADLQAASNPYFNVLYCRDIDEDDCKDESKQDPTLAVTRDPATGKIYRRIKHFSGYNVAAGRTEDSYNLAPTNTAVVKISALPNFAAMMPLFSVQFARRSGYILASG